MLNESPFWRVKLSFGRIAQLPRSLSEAEIRGLLVQAKQSHSAANVPRKRAVLARGNTHRGLINQYRPLRNLALLDLLFATGMRVGEVSGLNLEDFGVAESVFRVKGKGGRDRLAFLVDDQSRSIQQEHLELRSGIASSSHALFLKRVGCTAINSGHCEHHFSISEKRRNRATYHPAYAATHCRNSPVTQWRRY